MMLVCIASAVCVYARAYTFNMMSEKIAWMIRYDLVWQLLSKDIGWYDSQKTGDILSRISNDTSMIQDGLSTNISMFFRSFVFIIASIGIMVFI
jgi:ABC-type bacteriocin/lantibiotic exporter with double-glycine peptidase domain